jgi:hypothetical protein
MADAGLYGLGHAATVEWSAPAPDGSLFTLKWKAWQPVGQLVRWELKRILPSVGYMETGQNNIKDMVKDQLPTWTAWWTLCGLGSEHFGKSRNSLKHAGASMASMLDAEQEYWVSTKALLVLMVHWPRFRKNMSDKSKSSLVGISFLKKVCPRDALLALELGVVDPGWLGSCLQQERYAGKCRCVSEWLGRQEQVQADTAHTGFFQVCCAMAKLGHCSTIMLHLGSLLSTVGDHIDGSKATWSSGTLADAIQASIAVGGSGNKKRRVDPHLKEQVASIASGTIAGSNPIQAMVGLGAATSKDLAHWQETRLAQLQASAHLTCKAAPLVISSAFDGARIGTPSSEVLVHVIQTLAGKSIVLPPAVLGPPECDTKRRPDKRSPPAKTAKTAKIKQHIKTHHL